jgi:ribonucleoside-diphosphate reductase beta chain
MLLKPIEKPEGGFPLKSVEIDPSIFNVNKTDYETKSLFLGQQPGLFDTINKTYPQIWENYKTMKSQDWDETEIPFSSCMVEFETEDARKVRKMIYSLAWQWEADSVASRSISHIVSLFDPASELWAAWQRVSDNEVVHGATYSEIVRGSFKDPRKVLEEVLGIVEAHQRLAVVANEFSWIRRRGLLYQLGEVPNDQETYNAIFMFTFLMFVLERLQFMSSFVVTFAMGEENSFMPACKAIQKIAQDEFEVHVELDRMILNNELQTERGKIAYRQLKPRMQAVYDAVVNAEITWLTDVLWADGYDLQNLNLRQATDWVYWCGLNVARPMGLETNHPIVDRIPVHYMKTWLNISDIQPSPQEEANAQYKVGLMERDDEDVEFAVDF